MTSFASRSHQVRKDGGKERLFKELAAVLTGAGYMVRREKLRQGHGWKVVSGTCRARASRLVFVDSRLPIDEQVAFLVSQVLTNQVEIPADKVPTLSGVLGRS